MKVIIEGEPKEIAAYELALKDGRTQQIFNTYNSMVSPTEIARHCKKAAGDLILRHV